MATIQIATFNQLLTNGSSVIFDKPKFNNQKTATLTGQVKLTMGGTCDGFKEKTISVDGTYAFDADTNTLTKSFVYTHKCTSVSLTITLRLTDFSSTQYSLMCELASTKNGQAFITGNFESSIYLASVNMELPSYTLSYPKTPSHTTYTITRNSSLVGSVGVIVSSPTANGTTAIYHGDSLTISAAAADGYAAPTFHFGQAGITTIPEATGNITATVLSNGIAQHLITKNLAPHTSVQIKERINDEYYPTDCDGGCYCWCNDGTQVDDGTKCPEHYAAITTDRVPHNAYLRITPSVDTGYRFVSMTINGVKHTDNTRQHIYARAPISISTEVGYVLTLSPAAGTAITVKNAAGAQLTNNSTVKHGEALTISANGASSVYALSGLAINGIAFDHTQTHTITASDHTLITTQSIGTFSLSVSQDAHATITVVRNGSVITAGTPIYTGDTLTITATAAEGYWINSLNINGSGYTGNTTSAITVNGNVNISASTVQTTIIRTSLAQGTSVQFYREISPPYPPECDGGCYCYCDGEQYADGEIALCDGKYEPIAPDEPIFIGTTILISPAISTGYTIDTYTVNGTVYDILKSIRLVAGEILTIATETTASTKWRPLITAPITISGNEESVYKTINGLDPSRKTRFNIQSGSYKSGGMVQAEPDWCDGGCYCYCGGEQIADGEYCSVYKTHTDNIASKVYIADSNTLALSNSTSVANATLVVSQNTLIFNGYSTYYPSDRTKTITIKKLDQYIE